MALRVGGRTLVDVTVDDEAGLGDRLCRTRRSLALGIVPGRGCAPGSAAMSSLDARVRSSNARKPPSAPSWLADDEEALGLLLPPSRCDLRRRLALPGQDEVQDRVPIVRQGRLGILLAPDVPVERRHDAGKAAEHVLGVGDRALLLAAPSRPQAVVDVAADPTEHPPVAVGVTPAKIGLQGVAGQIVREHTRRPRLHERQTAQPREQLVRVLQPEHLPQQHLGGHPGDRAHLQGAAMQPAGDDVHEPSQQRAHQIWGQRVGRRLAAANDHIGEQRQPQRVAMGQLDQLIVAGRIDATGLEVLAAVLRAQIAQRHHPQQLTPGRVGAPGRTRCCPSGDDREGGGRQARQQPSAHPVIERREPLIGVEQDHQPAAVGRPADGTLARSGTSSTAAERLEHGRGRREEVAPVQTDHARTGVGRKPRKDVQQARLADARWPVELQHRERRLG